MIRPDQIERMCSEVWHAVGKASDYADCAITTDESTQVILTDNWKTVVVVTKDQRMLLFHPAESNVYKDPHVYPIARLVGIIQEARLAAQKGPVSVDFTRDMLAHSVEILKEVYGQKGIDALCETMGVTESWLYSIHEKIYANASERND